MRAEVDLTEGRYTPKGRAGGAYPPDRSTACSNGAFKNAIDRWTVLENLPAQQTLGFSWIFCISNGFPQPSGAF
jgi:hypothetical protein